eukprot:TRINITY_DN1115_c0_g1_i4.p1 TRINITY_DN1115_c0_g1~~TRINITY_DN1115_c0_g1_i4.p1  ORF type:complete len:464 (-),score=81.50 TRINITY_DN1115_c0_g1_i4:319-1710(-)
MSDIDTGDIGVTVSGAAGGAMLGGTAQLNQDTIPNDISPLTGSNDIADPHGLAFASRGKAGQVTDIVDDTAQSSNWAIVVNTLKSFIGTGILALPYAFAKSGVLAGVIGLVLVAILTLHCMLVLVELKQQLTSHRAESFSDVAYHAVGTWGAWVVDICLIMTQAGFCAGYFVFIGNTMNGLLPQLSFRYWILIAFPVLAGLSLLRSLKALGPVSVLGVGSVILSLLVVFAYCLYNLKDGVGPDIKYAQFSGIPVFLGILTAAFEGIGLVLPIENSARDKDRFPKMLNVALIVVSVLYMSSALLGYLAFGNEVHDIIILDLPQNGAVIIFIELLLVVTIVFTYPVQIFPVLQILEGSSMFRKFTVTHKTLKVNLARIGIVILTAGVAAVVPNYGLLIGLVGSLGSATLAYIMPALFHYVLNKDRISTVAKVKDGCIIAFGVVIVVMGTGYSVADIITSFNDTTP